jgi:hypothetical protein
MKLASSEARNTTALAISSGVPSLPSGTLLEFEGSVMEFVLRDNIVNSSAAAEKPSAQASVCVALDLCVSVDLVHRILPILPTPGAL